METQHNALGLARGFRKLMDPILKKALRRAAADLGGRVRQESGAQCAAGLIRDYLN